MCDSSNEKQGEKLFLLWRHSALLVRPFSWLAKNRRQGNPCEYDGDWSIRYGALCRSKLLSPALEGSLVSPLIVEKATENEIYARGKFCLLSLSLSLSLSLRVSTLEKKKISPGSAQLIQTKLRKAPVPSLFFLLWTSRSTCGIRTACALDEDSAGVTIVGSRTNLGVPALTNLLPQTSLNVATRSPELTQLAVADSKEKKSEPFPGILQWGAAFWPTTWLLNGGNFCRVRITVTF